MFAVLLFIGSALFLHRLWQINFNSSLASVPGPLLARFSNLWKIMVVYQGDMPRRNVDLRRRYGSVVRIGPNHVSFASPEALKTIYTSRPSFPKSDFYKAANPLHMGKRLSNLFSVQNVEYHARLKRKVNSLYTKSAVLQLQPQIDKTVALFLHKMSDLTDRGAAIVDMSFWLHLFSFDSLGDINLNKTFGFLESGRDVNGLIANADKILHMTGLYGQSPLLQEIHLHIKDRWSRTKPNPLLLYAANQITERLSNPTDDPDLLNSFIRLQDADSGNTHVSVDEIAGALYINLMAGHDVLAITLRTILYDLSKSPTVLGKLRDELAELDRRCVHTTHLPYTELTKLRYLDAVIYEALRIHAGTGMILERVVPYGGANIDGHFLPAGTVVGVNAWVLHSNETVFGADTDVFKPERWLDVPEEKVSEMKRFMFSVSSMKIEHHVGLSTNTNSLVMGRGSQNIAMAQICKVVAEFLRRFDARLENPDKEWHVYGSWVTNQTDMDMVVTRLL